MTLYIPGTSDVENLVRFDRDAADPSVTLSNRPTVAAAIWRFTPRGSNSISGDTTHSIARSNPNGNTDLGINTQVAAGGQTGYNIRVRTTAKNSHNSASVTPAVDDAVYLGVRIDFTSRDLRFYSSSGLIGDPVVLDEGDSWHGSEFSPFIRGRRADGRDTEWEEVAYWHNANDLEGDASDYVPTDAQMLAYSPGDDISGWPQTKSHVKPTGTTGAVATMFPDLSPGGAGFNLVTGLTSGSFAPYFVGTEEIGARYSTPYSLAVDLAYSVRVTGTTHILVGPASANASDPTPAQIKAGQNQNGTFAPAQEAFTESSTGPKERRLTGLFGSTNYKAFAVIETDTDEFTDVISWTFTTPRMGLRTDPIYTPGASPALWVSQTAIDVAVAAQGMPSVIDTAETDSSGRLVVDLSAAEGFYLPVGGSAKVGWEKGSNFGFQSATIENLDA